VTEYLQLLLRKSGYNFHTTAEKEVVRIIKEKTCYIPVNPVKEEKETSGKTDDFMLPDGNIIRVSSRPTGTLFEVYSTCIDFSEPLLSWEQSDSAHLKFFSNLN
jgi:Actin